MLRGPTSPCEPRLIRSARGARRGGLDRSCSNIVASKEYIHNRYLRKGPTAFSRHLARVRDSSVYLSPLCIRSKRRQCWLASGMKRSD